MSGLGEPALTAMPTPELAISTRLAGIILPSLTNASMSGAPTITRSKVSPALMRFLMSAEPLHVAGSAFKLRDEFEKSLFDGSRGKHSDFGRLDRMRHQKAAGCGGDQARFNVGSPGRSSWQVMLCSGRYKE